MQIPTKTGRHGGQRPLTPQLRFSPTAWAKLVYLRDRGDTEVGGFGITAAEDPFLIEEFHLVDQVCSPVSVCFGDLAVADYFDRQVDRGLKPARFARIWMHTHPGDSAEPSSVDEQTFDRVFAATDWAVMFILARGGQAYARLRFTIGPGAALLVPVAIDYSRPFPASDYAGWDLEYQTRVRPESSDSLTVIGGPIDRPDREVVPELWEPWPELWDDWMPAELSDVYEGRVYEP